MKQEKQNRFEETRNFETRNYQLSKDQIRKNIQMSMIDPFYIPPEIIPENMVYGWKRVSINKYGEYEDKGRIPECMGKGWTAVPMERHPELNCADYLGISLNKHGYIQKGGQLLMERSLDDHLFEIDQINKHTEQQTNSNDAIRLSEQLMTVHRNSVSYGTY